MYKIEIKIDLFLFNNKYYNKVKQYLNYNQE